jgi:DNA-3-methyladenine glycosylase II
MNTNILSSSSLRRFTRELCARDPDLKRVVEQHGAPPLWERSEGFATLTHIILEQQVSLASAKAVFERLCSVCPPEARAVAALGEDGLRGVGITRQKAHYIWLVANEVLAGRLDFSRLRTLNDDHTRTELTRLKGVGVWTADVYLLMALRRADVFPSGDLALQIAAQEVKRLAARPQAQELESIAETWKPYRAVAARILWQHYLAR